VASGGAPVGPLQICEIDTVSLQPRLLLRLADTERTFGSHLAYGGNALAFFSSSGSIRVPLDAGNIVVALTVLRARRVATGYTRSRR
jgi:hypothetical protein